LFAEALEELARLRARGVTGESSRSGGDEERTLLKALQTARARRRFTADDRRIDRMLWRLGCRLFSKK
jgi:hypothetical protein